LEPLRVAALADVHGNLPALEAVLADVEREGVDLIVFCGDVALGLLPRETLDAVMRLDARFVRGNCEREMVAAYDSGHVDERGLLDEWAIAQLEPRHRDFMASFEPTVSADGVRYCHATPHDDMPILTRMSPDQRVRELIGEIDERVVVCGHTHMQFDRTVDGIRIVNAGSVGMPYGTTAACWALIEDGDAKHRRTQYDLEAAAERLRASGHRERDRLIAENVLQAPSEEEAIEFFERQAAAG
jgi:putative phosphoesterase